MTISIHTERLTLRSAGGEAAAAVLDYVCRNRGHLREWESARQPWYYTLEGQRRRLEDEARQMDGGGLFKLWLYGPQAPERVIGSVALSNIIRGAFLSCHLGYGIDGGEAGKGFMTEAVRAIARYAFEELQLHRIEANVMPRNAASLRVTEKAGFVPEGLARRYLRINGVWEDHLHMVLLNDKLE